MFKRAKVVMLPTKQQSNIRLLRTAGLQYKRDMLFHSTENTNPQHLYITSDEEIKEGDWFLINGGKGFGGGLIGQHYKGQKSDKNDKKVIVSTDKSLVLEGIAPDGQTIAWRHPFPEPSPAFIEKYISLYNAGTPITDVLVEYELVLTDKVHDNIIVNGEPLNINEEKLKVDKNNCITIKKFEEKMYTREEVIKICKDLYRGTGNPSNSDWIEKWIDADCPDSWNEKD